MQIFDAIGRAGFAIDALGVEAVHLHMLQHHLQNHRHRVLFTHQFTNAHFKVLSGVDLIALWIHRRSQELVFLNIKRCFKLVPGT